MNGLEIGNCKLEIARIGSIRVLISPAALLVKVTAKIFSGLAPFAIRYLIRSVITLVFPAPAPAITKTGPSVASTASFCLEFSLSAEEAGGFFFGLGGWLQILGVLDIFLYKVDLGVWRC